MLFEAAPQKVDDLGANSQSQLASSYCADKTILLSSRQGGTLRNGDKRAILGGWDFWNYLLIGLAKKGTNATPPSISFILSFITSCYCVIIPCYLSHPLRVNHLSHLYE